MKRGENESIYVPTRSGKLVQRSCGTALPQVVRGMKRMVRDCRAEPSWLPILDALESSRLTLRDAYTYYASKKMDALAARLGAVDLAQHLDGWYGWCVAERQAGVGTPQEYWRNVRSLIAPNYPRPDEGKERTTPDQFPSSDLTKARVITWLASFEGTSSGYRRKMLYALRSFINYLLDIGVYQSDPIAGFRAPRRNKPRERWETAERDETIVANALPRYTAYFAFIHGVGCDVGSADRCQKGDVNVFAGTTLIRGTKTDRRKVHDATIEPWALPYVRAHIKAMQGHDRQALVFPKIPRRAAQLHHIALCERLGIEHYTMKDARHSVAVRMRKAGKSFEEIAAQLGTSVYQVVNVYAKYKPDAEKLAAEAVQV